MTIHLVERMTEPPACCLVCGSGNVPQNDGLVHPAVDLGADVNWGDSTYLCEMCATIVGATIGMLTTDDAQDYKSTIRGLQKQVHDLEATIDTKRRTERAAVRRARARETVSAKEAV